MTFASGAEKEAICQSSQPSNVRVSATHSRRSIAADLADFYRLPTPQPDIEIQRGSVSSRPNRFDEFLSIVGKRSDLIWRDIHDDLQERERIILLIEDDPTFGEIDAGLGDELRRIDLPCQAASAISPPHSSMR
jgi:hypothetical protein